MLRELLIRAESKVNRKDTYVMNNEKTPRKEIIKNIAIVFLAVLLVLTRWVKPTKKLHPIVYIAASAVVGIVFSFAGV